MFFKKKPTIEVHTPTPDFVFVTGDLSPSGERKLFDYLDRIHKSEPGTTVHWFDYTLNMYPVRTEMEVT